MRDEIDPAQKELDGTASAPRVMPHAVELASGINTAVSQIDTISSTYLQPLQAFNTVVSAITNVRSLAFVVQQSNRHCYADPPLCEGGVGGINQCRTGASSPCRTYTSHHSFQLIINQATLDNSVSSLLLKVKYVYEFLLEGDTLSSLVARKDTLEQIARVISDCAQFMVDYSERKSFCGPFRLLP